MSNGNEYLLGEFDAEIEKRENTKPDFSLCGVGEDFAEAQHTGTTLLLKDARLRQKDEVDIQKVNKVGKGFQVTGWGSVAASILWLMAKVHGWAE